MQFIVDLHQTHCSTFKRFDYEAYMHRLPGLSSESLRVDHRRAEAVAFAPEIAMARVAFAKFRRISISSGERTTGPALQSVRMTRQAATALNVPRGLRKILFIQRLA
ncbi:hypothetical protein KYN89_11345 [Alteriqipengyuania sp. NZ-12B]|uniref:Uncharacterized protein n=1 Tax=Alteriqipengyuania abyssalis TaxID=2860200 RepID=A0ABS7PEZ0_9SPHN|nr:hypothetical protein [Alteriqipengyuania abyssalis]MBY8337636.1 hypothetical protein [Alteriqipengyuania abyssalis]